MGGFQLKNGKQTFQRSGQHQTTLRFVSTDPMKNRFFNFSKKIQALLLGDAAHPTMPNLGQGGAMAIEDAYALAEELACIKHTDEIERILKSYESRRFIRASIAQFLSRNGSDLLVDWEKLRTTPIIGQIAMKSINIFHRFM